MSRIKYLLQFIGYRVIYTSRRPETTNELCDVTSHRTMSPAQFQKLQSPLSYTVVILVCIQKGKLRRAWELARALKGQHTAQFHDHFEENILIRQPTESRSLRANRTFKNVSTAYYPDWLGCCFVLISPLWPHGSMWEQIVRERRGLCICRFFMRTSLYYFILIIFVSFLPFY